MSDLLIEEARDLWYALDNCNWAEHEGKESYRTSRLARLTMLARARWYRRRGRMEEYRAELRSAQSIGVGNEASGMALVAR